MADKAQCGYRFLFRLIYHYDPEPVAVFVIANLLLSGIFIIVQCLTGTIAGKECITFYGNANIIWGISIIVVALVSLYEVATGNNPVKQAWLIICSVVYVSILGANLKNAYLLNLQPSFVSDSLSILACSWVYYRYTERS